MQVTNLVSYKYAYMFVKMTLVCMTQTGHQMDNSLREIFFFPNEVPIFKFIFILIFSHSASFQFILT